MSAPIVVIIVVTLVVTLVVLGVLVYSVMRRVTAVAVDVVDIRDRLLPDLEQLRRDAEIASGELERVSGSFDDLQRQRRDRTL